MKRIQLDGLQVIHYVSRRCTKVAPRIVQYSLDKWYNCLSLGQNEHHEWIHKTLVHHIIVSIWEKFVGEKFFPLDHIYLKVAKQNVKNLQTKPVQRLLRFSNVMKLSLWREGRIATHHLSTQIFTIELIGKSLWTKSWTKATFPIC